MHHDAQQLKILLMLPFNLKVSGEAHAHSNARSNGAIEIAVEMSATDGAEN